MSIVIARGPSASSSPADTDLDVVRKLVPVEVISPHAALVAAGAASSLSYGSALVAAAGLVATALVLELAARGTDRAPTLAQHAIRLLTFVAWAFLLDNPLAPSAPVDRRIPGLAVIVIPTLGALLFPPAGVVVGRPRP